MNKLVYGKIAHTLSNLIAHIQTLFSGFYNLYKYIGQLKTIAVQLQMSVKHACVHTIITFSCEDSSVK